MKVDTMTAVVMAAAELKLSSPLRYDTFIQAMNAHARRAHVDLLAASRDGIYGAQGRAQALDELAKKLENCQQLFEQLRART
jgi:hypothetical protein